MKTTGFTENEISINSQGGTEITKRSIAKLIDPQLSEQFQIIPSRIRELNDEKIRIYWQHDLAEDPEVKPLQTQAGRDKFHQFVFSSNWALQDFVTKLKFPRDHKVRVIETPIEPFKSQPKNFDDGIIRIVYFSTPQRGLSLLVPVFEELAKKYSNIHLDVFSSFKIYGWEEMDKQFEPIYESIRKHPQMTYHGFADQTALRTHLKKAHILAYPSIWTETSCRVLMESMSAGLFCVHSNLGALPDTSGGLTSMYQYVDDVHTHANVFYQYLENAILQVNTPEAQGFLKLVKAYADTRFSLEKIAQIWQLTLEDLLKQYPDAQSRSLPVNKAFVYEAR